MTVGMVLPLVSDFTQLTSPEPNTGMGIVPMDCMHTVLAIGQTLLEPICIQAECPASPTLLRKMPGD